MNGLLSQQKEVKRLITLASRSKRLSCEILVCPPATLLHPLKSLTAKTAIRLGAQACHPNEAGAHTGDLSAEMIRDAGGRFVIVGHSERRADHGESNAQVEAQASAVHRAGLKAIVCVGETEAERDAGRTLRIVGEQVRKSMPSSATAANTIVAYEPVWAIGTGRTPTVEDVAQVHRHIRKTLTIQLGASTADKVRILYGGSVKPGNAAELMAVENVDGALVGGASLKANDFWGIISVYNS